jgi:hemerythrin-like domain-containing protein
MHVWTQEDTVADAMTMLKADHREVKRMLNTLAEMDEGREREELTQKLQTELTLHMEIEERLLYPLVAQYVGREDEEEAEIEHGLAREGLQKVVELVSKPGFGAAVEMLSGGIGHHVSEEESEILPELKGAMPREEWRQLGEQISEMKSKAGAETRTTTRSGRRSSKRTTAKR